MKNIDRLTSALHCYYRNKLIASTIHQSTFASVADLSISFCRKLDRRKDKGLKERLEVADFSNLRWKIEGVDVSLLANTTISAIMQINDR